MRRYNLTSIYQCVLIWVKIKKQLTYANKKNIRFIIFYGKEEMESKTLILRDMKKNIQKKIKFIKPDQVFIDNLIKYI